MVLNFWELDHEEILTVVRACGYGECSLIMISPLLLEGRKEEFMMGLNQMFVQPKNRSDSLCERYIFPNFKTSGSDAKNTTTL